jgi:hypothetical protein
MSIQVKSRSSIRWAALRYVFYPRPTVALFALRPKKRPFAPNFLHGFSKALIFLWNMTFWHLSTPQKFRIFFARKIRVFLEYLPQYPSIY